MSSNVKNQTRIKRSEFAIGGVWTSPTRRRSWRFDRGRSCEIQALPCKSEQWFVVQATNAGAIAGEVRIEFEDASGLRYPRVVPLYSLNKGDPPQQHGFALGWAQAPVQAKTVRLAGWPDGQLAENIAQH